MQTPNFSYDYTKCMMMKMPVDLSVKGVRTKHNAEQVLEMAKAMDSISQGITKIIYLIGWQYNGHDDKYPDFFQVNQCLKRSSDASAYDSLLWLMNEAKQYNTIISFHINFNDAYDDAPSFQAFVDNKALIRNKDGSPCAIEKYNNKTCYKTSFKEYWESGLFARQVGKLLELFPIEQAKTIHVDNFQCYSNFSPNIQISEMQKYRDKMIDYLRQRGIDITTEFTCREHNELRNKTLFGTPRDHRKDKPIDILGKIPAVWWLTYLSDEELIAIDPHFFGGGLLRNGTRADYREEFIYGNIHGEDEFKKYALGEGIWIKEFIESFATIQVPYHFLCKHKRLNIGGSKSKRFCQYSEDIISYRKGQIITQNGHIIKDGSSLCLPYGDDNTFFAYSKDGDSRCWRLNYSKPTLATIYEVSSTHKPAELLILNLDNGNLPLTLQKGQALLIVCKSID